MTRVDAHHHLWELARRPQPWTDGLPALQRSFAMSDLEPALARNGIEKTVLVQTATSGDETVELLALGANHKQVGGVIGWADLAAISVDEQLARLLSMPAAGKLVGVRHQVRREKDPQWLSNAAVRRGLRAVAEVGLAFDLLIRSDQFESALQTARALPQLRFVLDHAAAPALILDGAAEARRRLTRLSALPNVAAKLSGYASDPRRDGFLPETMEMWMDFLLSSFGPQRLMFGSDWPACLVSSSYDDTLAVVEKVVANLGSGERHAVLGDTALGWYRMSR